MRDPLDEGPVQGFAGRSAVGEEAAPTVIDSRGRTREPGLLESRRLAVALEPGEQVCRTERMSGIMVPWAS